MTLTQTLSAAAAPLPREEEEVVFFRPACLDDLEAVMRLEAASYPEDEAATPEKLRMRMERASEAFMVAVSSRDDSIVGFACGEERADGRQGSWTAVASEALM